MAIKVIIKDVGTRVMIGLKALIKAFQLKILSKNMVQNAVNVYCPLTVTLTITIANTKTAKIPKAILLAFFMVYQNFLYFFGLITMTPFYNSDYL